MLTRASSTNFFPKPNPRHDRDDRPNFQTQKICRAVRRRRREYRAVQRRAQRQRSPLPRLRHSRSRGEMRVRGSRAFARAWESADTIGTRGLQGEAQGAARIARDCANNPRSSARRRASDGRAAHRRLGARLRAAGKGGPRCCRHARDHRPPPRLAEFDAAVLVSLLAQRRADRGDDGRRLHRRPFSAPVPRRGAEGVVGARDARLAHSLRRARVQRLDVHDARDHRHRRGYLLRAHGRHRRAARPEARRRKRVRV